MKEKRLLKLLFAFLACCSLTVSAANGELPEVLVLKFADDHTAKFLLADKPEISFADSKLTVTSQSLTTDYELSQVVEFHFTNATSDVADKLNANDFSFSYIDNISITVKGTHALYSSLYNTDGRLIKRQRVENRYVQMSLEDCALGTYIFNLEGEQSFKIIKK